MLVTVHMVHLTNTLPHVSHLVVQFGQDMTPVDISEQWREDWSSASVVNNVLVTDHTIWQPGFDLSCRSRSLLNHFQTGQDCCLFDQHKCGLASLDLCVSGQLQTMNHVVNSTCVHSRSLEADCSPYLRTYVKLVMMQSTRQMKHLMECRTAQSDLCNWLVSLVEPVV